MTGDEKAISRTSLVTGASSGIGASVSLRLARESGSRLLLVGRDRSRLLVIADECRSAGAEVSVIRADLAEDAGIRTIIEAGAAQERLDSLIHCAGLGRFGTIEELNASAFDEVLAVNLRAPFLLTRGLVSAMQRSPKPIVTFIGSDVERTPFEHAGIYSASKAGLLALVRCVALELRPIGIRMCVVSPGRTDTRFNGKEPGDRPGALTADDVAEVIQLLQATSQNLEVAHVEMDSMSRGGYELVERDGD